VTSPTAVPPLPLLDRPPVRVRECRHGTFAYLATDQYVGTSLDLLGEFAEHEVEALAVVLKPGCIAVDAGANIGALTVPMARMVGPTGMVIAFEPQRVLFQLLSANAMLNGLLNVQGHHAALGTAAGVVDVPALAYDEAGNFGGVMLAGWVRPAEASGRLGEADASLREPQPAPTLAAASEPVPVRPLDELDLGRLDFLKIDVEGMERDVLLGADRTLARCRPFLLVENDRDRHSPALIRALMDRGYRLYWHIAPLYRLDNYRKYPTNPWPAIHSANVLAIPKERPAVAVGLREITGPESSWRDRP
jgi:FkbM family methyltransferase